LARRRHSPRPSEECAAGGSRAGHGSQPPPRDGTAGDCSCQVIEPATAAASSASAAAASPPSVVIVVIVIAVVVIVVIVVVVVRVLRQWWEKKRRWPVFPAINFILIILILILIILTVTLLTGARSKGGFFYDVLSRMVAPRWVELASARRKGLRACSERGAGAEHLGGEEGKPRR